MGEGFSVADVMALAKDGDGFGGGGLWVLFLFFLLAWGGGGFFGNNGNNAAAQGALTRSDMCQEFNGQEVLSKLDGLGNGICDASYALNNSIKDLGMTVVQTGYNGQMTANQGFNDVTAAVTRNGYEQQDICNRIGQQIAEVKYANEQNTCAVINAVNAGVQRVIDNQTNQLIQTLRDDLQNANYTIQNNAQTSALIGMLRPFPQPAYITCSPYTSNTCAYAA